VAPPLHFTVLHNKKKSAYDCQPFFWIRW